MQLCAVKTYNVLSIHHQCGFQSSNIMVLVPSNNLLNQLVIPVKTKAIWKPSENLDILLWNPILQNLGWSDYRKYLLLAKPTECTWKWLLQTWAKVILIATIGRFDNSAVEHGYTYSRKTWNLLLDQNPEDLIYVWTCDDLSLANYNFRIPSFRTRRLYWAGSLTGIRKTVCMINYYY